MSARVSKYQLEELLVLVQEYEELREIDNKAWITVRLVDLWRAYDSLADEQKQAVLLMGMFGYSSRTCEPMLKTSHSTVTKRYASGLAGILRFLNGGV